MQRGPNEQEVCGLLPKRGAMGCKDYVSKTSETVSSSSVLFSPNIAKTAKKENVTSIEQEKDNSCGTRSKNIKPDKEV